MATRIRKTFRYPTDDVAQETEPEFVDEEEQETIIRNLRSEDSNTNILFKRILLVLNSIVLLLLTIKTLNQDLLFSKVAIPCLGNLLSLVVVIPVLGTALQAADIAAPSWSLSVLVDQARVKVSIFAGSALLALISTGLIQISGDGSVPSLDFQRISCLAPVMAFANCVAQQSMDSVNVEELEALRYEYKGA